MVAGPSANAHESQSLLRWVRSIIAGNFDLTESAVSDEWFLQKCRDLAAEGETLLLTDEEVGYLLITIPGWLGDIALNGAIVASRRIEATEVARELFNFASRTTLSAHVTWYWREFMRAHDKTGFLKGRHLDDSAMQDVHTYLLDMFREFLASPDPAVVAGGLVGLDWIWGDQKQQILRDFLATDPGHELTSLANGAMESNLW